MTTRGRGFATRRRRTHLRVVLLITPLRSNLASTAKHHASAVDAMVRSCVSRARESVDEALGRAERDNESRKAPAPLRE